MILADTDVLIDYLEGRGPGQRRSLRPSALTSCRPRRSTTSNCLRVLVAAGSRRASWPCWKVFRSCRLMSTPPEGLPRFASYLNAPGSGLAWETA